MYILSRNFHINNFDASAFLHNSSRKMKHFFDSPFKTEIGYISIVENFVQHLFCNLAHLD
jgi:hypothetical protein